jgi:pimeloyl-ACP methyl ester carboxylesterase
MSTSTVRANGAEFHYLHRGTGTTVLFVHGGLVDHRRWAAQIDPFSQQHRVVAYSRRYNYPNKNSRAISDYSAITDGDDLAAIIRELKLGPCYIVAESYGAYAALFFATNHPELVRSLVLAEAPVLPWLNATAEGKQILNDFMNAFWTPVAEALRGGKRVQALEIIVDHFLPGTKISDVPVELREVLEDNLPEWEMLTTSRDAFPPLSRQTVVSIKVPVLLLGGERTLAEHEMIDSELEELISGARRLVVAGTTHEMWDEQPEVCRKHALRFISEHS